MEVSKGVEWTVIVLTCQYKDSVYTFQRELEIRQQKGFISPGVVLLTVEDPKAQVGSGGATLNALLVAAEHLSARAGYTVVTSDVLRTSRILILHMGRDFPFDDCGRSFTCLPAERLDSEVEALVCNIDILLHIMTHKLGPGSPPGVWVCSTDMILTIPSYPDICWEGFSGVRVVSVPGTLTYARKHGVYLLNTEGCVCDIIYKGTEERIQQCALRDGRAPLVSGIVFFSSPTAERLLATHVTPPLDACTYMGLDSGAQLIQLSIFFDILLCMAQNTKEDDFVKGTRSNLRLSSTAEDMDTAILRSARALLWRELRGIPVTVAYIADGSHEYMSLSADDHLQNLTRRGSMSGSFTAHHIAHSEVTVGNTPLSLYDRCFLPSVTHVPQCQCLPPAVLGSGCLLSGVDVISSLTLSKSQLCNVIIQGHHIRLRDMKLKVFTIVGRYDDLQVMYTQQWLHLSSGAFLAYQGCAVSDIWGPGALEGDRCLLNAQLFPVFHTSEPIGIEDVLWFFRGERKEKPGCLLRKWSYSWRMSLQQVLSCLDQETELAWRRRLFFNRAQHTVRHTLLEHRDSSLLPLIRAAVCEGHEQQILGVLDTVASTAEDLGVAARTLASIADVLGCLAKGQGGLRSGPAANQAWTTAFQLLESGRVAPGVAKLTEERANWLHRPDLLVRAARHYEGAEQILIRQAVMSARQFIITGQRELPPINQWVLAECPARIDLSGGWSDTPPITYEHGGAVVDIAVLVDKRKPIGAKVRRIAEPKLHLVLNSGGIQGEIAVEIVCHSLEDLQDYCQPHAPGALVKAAFICTEIISYPSHTSLQDQLMNAFGGGFELHSWSCLPHGSGLGTSSILAGAVMAALLTAAGRSYDTDSLIHAVLHLEQMLTTGGGWQDQVGGLVPGIKIGRSKPHLPLRVEVEPIAVTDDLVKRLNDRLLLIYTGKTRLARNLLQDVLRNWYARRPFIIHNTEALVSNAEQCARALSNGDLAQIGQCLNTYWHQKKCMAPGCEPSAVRRMMAALQPHVHGQSLAGAGGGGFLYILTRKPQQKAAIESILAQSEVLYFVKRFETSRPNKAPYQMQELY
uniref:L-fucose kinase n=1 Tax=Callorhinchus milii TaxID=7868 RepID=A0A4W3IP13_CALMI